MVNLKIDWATHESARFACEQFHYSKCLPCGKLVKIGAWENGKFIGVVLFSRGANYNMSKQYGLDQNECVELTRIALTNHVTPVSKIASIAVRFLKKQSPGIKLIVSYADSDQGHHGGIYQAMNWIYRGRSSKSIKVWYKGKWSHKKTVDDAGVNQKNLRKKIVKGKHTYLMPLNESVKNTVIGLAKPYPKRPKQAEPGPPGMRRGSTDPDAPSLSQVD